MNNLKKDKKIICIVSGGMDSVTLLYDLKAQGYDIVGVLSVNYGQRHVKELQCAIKICENLKLDHRIVNLKDLKYLLNGSALTDKIAVPEGHYEAKNMKLTVVPFRNSIMLMIACGFAVSKGAQYVAYGAHSGDHAIYWDCRPGFVKEMNIVAQMSEPKIKIIAPYLKLNKISILKKGIKLSVPYENTWTCYAGKKNPCGHCGSDVERTEAFLKNGLKDPLYNDDDWNKAVKFYEVR